jgi:hypothetical protein
LAATFSASFLALFAGALAAAFSTGLATAGATTASFTLGAAGLITSLGAAAAVLAFFAGAATFAIACFALPLVMRVLSVNTINFCKFNGQRAQRHAFFSSKLYLHGFGVTKLTHI